MKPHGRTGIPLPNSTGCGLSGVDFRSAIPEMAACTQSGQNHGWNTISLPFPAGPFLLFCSAFPGSRDQSSGFPLSHLRIRGLSKRGVRGVRSSLRCTAPCRLHYCFLTWRITKHYMPLCTSKPFFHVGPSSRVTFVWQMGCHWSSVRRENRCHSIVLTISLGFLSESCLWFQILLVIRFALFFCAWRWDWHLPSVWSQGHQLSRSRVMLRLLCSVFLPSE